MTSLKLLLLPIALLAAPFAAHADERDGDAAYRRYDRAPREVYWEGNCRVEQRLNRYGELVERRSCGTDERADARPARRYERQPQPDQYGGADEPDRATAYREAPRQADDPRPQPRRYAEAREQIRDEAPLAPAPAYRHPQPAKLPPVVAKWEPVPRIPLVAAKPAAPKPAPRIVAKVQAPVAHAPRIVAKVHAPVVHAPRLVAKVQAPVAHAPRIVAKIQAPVVHAPRVVAKVQAPVVHAPRIVAQVQPPVKAPRIAAQSAHVIAKRQPAALAPPVIAKTEPAPAAVTAKVEPVVKTSGNYPKSDWLVILPPDHAKTDVAKVTPAAKPAEDAKTEHAARMREYEDYVAKKSKERYSNLK